MTSDEPRRVEVTDDDQIVAAAEVTTQDDSGGAVRASLFPASGHIRPGSRASLVDAVLDLPEVQSSARLEATVPLGDTESLDRLRERTEATETRAAGSTALVDADIPAAAIPAAPGREPATLEPANQEPAGQEPAGQKPENEAPAS